MRFIPEGFQILAGGRVQRTPPDTRSPCNARIPVGCQIVRHIVESVIPPGSNRMVGANRWWR